MSKGYLKPEDDLCLRKHYQYLKENIEASDLVEFLFAHNVMTLDDKNKICKRETRSKRNKVLLDFLLHHGRKEDFHIFLQSLELEYKHVSQYLQDKDSPSSERAEHNYRDPLILTAEQNIDEESYCIEYTVADEDISKVVPDIGIKSKPWELKVHPLLIVKTKIDTKNI